MGVFKKQMYILYIYIEREEDIAVGVEISTTLGIPHDVIRN